MKEYRDDISARMLNHGRKPSDAKVLFLVEPILGETTQEAQNRNERLHAEATKNIEDQLAGYSYLSGFDFSSYDLDAPLADLAGKSNGHQSSVADLMKSGKGKTLREVAAAYHVAESIPLIGTPDDVAVQMGEAMDYAGGDGFLVALPVHRRFITEITDGLAPALRRRGLIRDGYEDGTFRDNLLAF